jgi:ABC-2 type transport system permease protein
MRRPLTVLVRIRLAEVIRRPSGAFWFFALPMILLFLVAALFQNGHPFERRHIAVVGDANAIRGALHAQIEAGGIAIEHVDNEDQARARLESRAVSAIVIVVTDSPDSPDSGTHMRVLVGDREELFGRGLVDVLGNGATLEPTHIAQNGYVRFLVPGMLAQGVVIAGLFGMGHAMVRYRQSRFLRKLATTPLSRAEFVLSQLVARMVLVSLQLLLMIFVARFAFDLRLSVSAVAWVLVVGAAGLTSFMGIGFVLSCVVKTEELVVDIINSVSVPIALLSEIFFSSDELPRVVRWLSLSLPSTAMVRAMRAVLLHGDDAMSAVLPSLAILAAWALVTFMVAVRAFKWR